MSTPVTDSAARRRTREEGIAIAAGRKAARRHRTSRMRKWIAVIAVSAFIGPFGVIYAEMSAAGNQTVATANVRAATRSSSAATTSTSSASSSTPAASTQSTTAAPVTTQQS